MGDSFFERWREEAGKVDGMSNRDHAILMPRDFPIRVLGFVEENSPDGFNFGVEQVLNSMPPLAQREIANQFGSLQ